MDFEAVLLGVGGVEDLDLEQFQDPRRRLLVDRHIAQGRGEGVGARKRQSLNGDAVARAQKHHPLDDRRGGSEQGIGRGGDGAGIDISGVRRD